MKTAKKSFSASTVLMALVCATGVQAQEVIRLAWVTQPGGVVAGAPFGTRAVIETVDQNGHFSTAGLGANLTLTISLASGNGTLTGTTSYNIGTAGSNGIVNLNDLAIVNGSGTNFQLTASTAGQGPAPGMSLWFDANAANTLTVNSTNGVTRWANQGSLSGGLVVPAGNDSFGSPPFYAPTLVSHSMNGRSVVRFATPSAGDSSDPGEGLENRWKGLDTGANIHFFVVARQPSDPPGSWSGFIGFGNEGAAAGKEYSSLGEDSGSSTNGFRIFRNDQDPSPSYSNPGQFTLPNHPGVGMGGNDDETGLGAWYNRRPANKSAFVNEFLYDGSMNAGVEDWQDQNGNTWTNYQVITSNPGNFNLTDFGLGGQLGLGGDAESHAADALDWPINIDIAEVVVYTNKLSASARGQVMDYLQNKWLNPADKDAAFPFVPGASATTIPFAVSPPAPAQRVSL